MRCGQPFFSIVLPTFNRSKFLAKAIQSVLDQSFDNFELIVVDDGSTDNTSEVVARFTDQRIRYFFKVNEERSIARNYGIDRAKGRYINFLDSDDFFYPEHLATAFENLFQRQFPELLHTRYELQDRTGTIVSKSEFVEKQVNQKLIFSNFLNGGCFFIKREALSDLSFIPHKDANFSEDWYLWLRLAARFPIHTVDVTTMVVTEHDHRSLRTVNPLKLERSLLLVLQELKKDSFVLSLYKHSFGYFAAECYSLIALHHTGVSNIKSATYLLRAMRAYPLFPKRRRFWAILKNLLFKPK